MNEEVVKINFPGPEASNEIESNQFIYDEFYDPDYAESICKNVITEIDRYFFKSRMIGFDELPEKNNEVRPIIYISNHSGMAFPWDAMVFASRFAELTGFHAKDMMRAVTAPALSKTNIMNPYLIRNFWKRVGGVDASFKNFETMMYHPENNILIYPEGVPGIGKGFNRRYQLQRFATSFVKMSVKYKTDVIPLLTINGEHINPYVFSFEKVNKLIRKIGIPFLPLGPLTLFLLIFPWMFYYAWPAKLTYVRGRRISPYKMIDKEYEDMTKEDIDYIRDRVKENMQEDMNNAVAEYGKMPFSTRKVLTWKLHDIWKMIYYSPPGWPMMFMEHERQYRKGGKESVEMTPGLWQWIVYLFRNPLSIAFFIPIIGWIPLLIKGYGKMASPESQKKK